MKKLITSVCSSLILISCAKEKNQPQKPETFTVNTFTDLPPEIDGCSCIFSEDSLSYAKEKYIYTNDFAATSFIKVNGKMIRLTETKHANPNSLTISKSAGSGYEVEIKAKVFRTTDLEYNEMKGTMTIKSKKGKTVTKTIYGVCGC